MATRKKVESAKRLQNHVQITSVDDPEKSLDDLFKFAKQHTSGQYNRKTQGSSFPISYYHPPSKSKSRNSSVGHSREGSSDEGFHSSRQTLSPAQGNVLYKTCLHPRQGSAPALINQEHPQQSSMSKLSPVGVHHAHSKSLNTVGATSTSDLANGGFGTGESFHSRTAKSCDFDQLPEAGGNFPISQANPQFYMDSQMASKQGPYWGGASREKERSKSLEAMTFSETTFSQQQQQQQQMMQHPMYSQPMTQTPSSTNVPDDGLGPLPHGYERAFDANGEMYFINHIDKTTDWFDPRIPRQLQEQRIRQRHAFSKTGMNQPQLNNNSLPPMGMPPQIQGYGSPHSTMENVHRLQMERSNMHDLQQQLSKDGLLDCQQQSPQFVQSPVHPQQQMGMYQDPQQQFLRTPMMNQSYHSRHMSNDAALDQTMEVDYTNYPMHQMNMPQQQQQLPIIEPIMRDLGMGDLNPQEFDKYLRINDGHQRSTAKYPL